MALGDITLGSTSSVLERYAAEKHRAGHLGPLFHDLFLAPLALLYLLEGYEELGADILAQCHYDTRTGPFPPIHSWVYLAEARLYYLRDQYDRVVSLLDRPIEGQAERGLNYFLGDLLLMKAQALLAMDPPQRDDARSVLRQAKLSQEEGGINRVLWRILAALAELVDEEEALLLRQQAWQIVSRISEGLEDDDLRQIFYRDADVEKVMAASIV